MHRIEVTVLQGRLAEQTDCHRLAEHSTATSIIDAVKTADADGVMRLAIAVGRPTGPGYSLRKSVLRIVIDTLVLAPGLKHLREVRFVVSSGELVRLFAEAFASTRAPSRLT